MRVILAATVLLAPSTALAAPLNLICRGEARYVLEETTTGQTTGADGYPSATSFNSERAMRTSETFRFEIGEDGTGRVKPPRVQIPLLRSGGKDGWWPLASAAVGENDIHAQFSFNFLNKPRVQIDRRTGDIEVAGYQFSFNGACEPAPDDTAPRKF
ncbi:hypothetical protein [Phenylobacterium sp.]|uniref:hypothetical protein n=1 Tax=Phenylobacterium sp. TaxID=1871053 RepID=UPI00286C6AEB|nr:hypothetical protein [Phenylobacterium sp.]